MSCSLLLYATTDNSDYFTFPECQKAAKYLGTSPPAWKPDSADKHKTVSGKVKLPRSLYPGLMPPESCVCRLF